MSEEKEKKSFGREWATLFMVLFILLTFWVAYKDFSEAGIDLVKVLVTPITLLWSAMFGIDKAAKQIPMFQKEDDTHDDLSSGQGFPQEPTRRPPHFSEHD